MATDQLCLTRGEGVMDNWVATRLVDWAAGRSSKETRKALRREMDEMAAGLAGPNPTPVERMLAETAALSWFALRLHEAQLIAGSCSEGGLTFAQSEHHQRRVDRAHRRLMATLKTLATVRRLAVPALQINLARNQVNLAGSPLAEQA